MNSRLKIQILGTQWYTALMPIDFAFQPIVNIHTGVCYGYEALMRNYDPLEFKSIEDFFNQAYLDNVLYPVELALREKAIEKFSRLVWRDYVKLFLNLDNRVLDTKEYLPGNTIKVLKQCHLFHDTVCFEISERQELSNAQKVNEILNAYRSQGFKIAVDDCGTGFAGLKLLYHTRPDFIKIDRFFIQGITQDMNKRLFVSSLVNLAHVMGSIVIAEGVETPQEYYSCRNIGCDLIQGFLVQHPETDIQKLQKCYSHIREWSETEQRKDRTGDKKFIDTEMEYIEPIQNHSDAVQVFERFKDKNGNSVFPVIDCNQEPLGIVSEKSFKDYAYSRYGNELLRNPAFGKNLSRFIARYPVADIHSPVEKILEIWSQNENTEGIIITDNLKYKGFLSARSLLKILNEKNVAAARDQNPLTRLPGNTLIYRYISEAIQEMGTPYVFVYFDFDHFKPYNDKYGFRQGDRVILLFSELLKNRTQSPNRFAGHIGGDDFFMGIQGEHTGAVVEDVMSIADRFRNDVESFYDSDAIEKGCIVSRDRDGSIATFPLMTVSSVIVELPVNRSRVCSADEISSLIAEKKKIAKNSSEKICVVRAEDFTWLSPKMLN